MLSLIADVHKSVGSHKEDRSSRKEGYNIIVIKESQHVRFWHMLGHKLENKLDFSSKKTRNQFDLSPFLSRKGQIVDRKKEK